MTLIMRPYCFGKTLNMSMLETFFSIKYANRGDLFEGFSIWQGNVRAILGYAPYYVEAWDWLKEHPKEAIT